MAITPTYHGLLTGKKFNKDFELPGHEFCSVKPTLDFVALFAKGNINNLEILTTDYKLVNSQCWERMVSNVELIVEDCADSLFNAGLGMMVQKQKGLFTCTEGTKPFFDKYGYDNKNLIHILRLNDTLFEYHNKGSFKEAIKWGGSLHVNDILYKINEGMPVDMVSLIAENSIEATKSLLECRKGIAKRNNKTQEQIMQDYVASALTRS